MTGGENVFPERLPAAKSCVHVHFNDGLPGKPGHFVVEGIVGSRSLRDKQVDIIVPGLDELARRYGYDGDGAILSTSDKGRTWKFGSVPVNVIWE